MPCAHLPADHHVLVEDPSPAQAPLVEKPERCLLDAATLAALGLATGMQVRFRRSPRDVALFTIAGEEPRAGCHGVARMTGAARKRLGSEKPFPARLEAFAPHPTMGDLEAPQSSEFIERLADDGKQDFAVALAPHGGLIEKFTSEQAVQFGRALAGRATVWRCLGWSMGGGAVQRWHITSTDLDDRSFPRLASISSRRFRHAVAFHGFSAPRLVVGGGAPKAVREEVRAGLEKALRGTKLGVDLGGEGRLFAGASPRNIVNRLSAGGGVQIEQPLEARERFGREIAETVAGVFSRL